MSARRLGDPPLQDELVEVLFLRWVGNGFTTSEPILVVEVLQIYPAIIVSAGSFMHITMEIGILLNALREELEDLVEARHL